MRMRCRSTRALLVMREIYNSSVGRKDHRVQVARRIFEQGMGRLS